MKDPLMVATFALVGVTFILVIITAVYVVFTGKMAKRMKEQTELQKKEFDLRIKPQYDMPKLELCETSGSKFKLRPRVVNAGFSPFRFDFVSLKFFNRDDPNKPYAEPIWIHKHIFPEKEYYREPIEFDCAKFINFPETEDVRDVRAKVYIMYFFEFSDLLGNRYRYPEKNEKLLNL